MYEWLLFVYPTTFRRAFGGQMVQVFRDSYRARKRDGRIGSLARLWLRTSIDLILSAVKEHTEKENLLMSNLKKHLVALSGCVVVIVGSIALLTYGRKHGGLQRFKSPPSVTPMRTASDKRARTVFGLRVGASGASRIRVCIHRDRSSIQSSCI